jgi:octaprenyl-diphosphate synthase
MVNLQNILEPLSGDLQKVDEKIRQHLETGVPIIDNSSMHLFLKGGKKIRASLVILSCGLNSEVSDAVIDLAAAMEIIHGASLIHDDIIDKSLMRRGDISVPNKYGDKVAVLAGDYMYSVGVNIAVKSRNDSILDSISAATKEMVKGELYQIEYSNIDRITEDHYFSIIERKTGRLMATSAMIGAVLSGLDSVACETLYNLGLDIGFAFQIVDDTFDFSDSSSITGKDIGNDFRDGKITLPFIYILKKGTDSEKKNLKDFASDPDNADWDKVKSIIHSSGAFDYSIKRARVFAENAKKRLEIFPESRNKKIIENLIDFIVERNY